MFILNLGGRIVMQNSLNNAGLGLAIPGMENNETKLSEDRYEIYVNNDFVGYKTLYNATDNLSDVDDFVRNQGIQHFRSQLEGDHYYIETEDQVRAKDVLHVYCQNR
jgi:hypothetical protein